MDWYIGNEWTDKSKGLRKKVLELKFSSLDKPHEIAKVQVRVENSNGLNGRPSKYLASEHVEEEQELELGTAITPVDCYVELLVRQMMVGERSKCFIHTSGGKETKVADGAETEDDDGVITFELTLEQILETKEIHKLSAKEMYSLALRYKEAGVVMFKTHPRFAHEYFARAAKCMIAFKPFERLKLAADGVDCATMQSLFMQIQTNLAACLLAEQRYDHVLYQTQFVEEPSLPPAVVANEKSIYRRAVAYYNLQEFEAAQRTIAKVPNYLEKREFVALQQRINESWKASNDQYKTLVQRMFNSGGGSDRVNGVV